MILIDGTLVPETDLADTVGRQRAIETWGRRGYRCKKASCPYGRKCTFIHWADECTSESDSSDSSVSDSKRRFRPFHSLVDLIDSGPSDQDDSEDGEHITAFTRHGPFVRKFGKKQ
jgi:hypothetical protein